MNRPTRVGPAKVVVAISAALLAVSAFTFGSALASNRGAVALPCRDGGRAASASASRTPGWAVKRCSSGLAPVLLRRAAGQHGELALRGWRGQGSAAQRPEW